MDDSEICNEDLCDYLEQGLRKIKDGVYVLEKVLAKSQELNLEQNTLVRAKSRGYECELTTTHNLCQNCTQLMELSQQLSHESTSSRESGYVSEPEKASQQNIRQSTGSSFDSSFPIEEVDCSSEPEIKLNHSAARKVEADSSPHYDEPDKLEIKPPSGKLSLLSMQQGKSSSAESSLPYEKPDFPSEPEIKPNSGTTFYHSQQLDSEHKYGRYYNFEF